MNKGNTKFYHEHISQNIVKLDERKDGFVDHRRKFLVKYCLPIQKKIQDLKEKIKYYENMRDTQFEVIEND